MYSYNSYANNVVVKYIGRVQQADHQDDSMSQVQLDTYRAVDELPKLADIIAELEKFRFRLHEDQKPRWAEDQDFLGQISTLDFTSRQKEAYSKRYGVTGQWVLETPEFQTWSRSGDGQHSVLWCPGNPGVGKTVVTSIAVNHITENTSGQRCAIVYIYCDYANVDTFSVRSLLGSLVRQLVAQISDAETIAELKKFMKQTAKNRNMTEEDFSSWTETLSRDFDVVYMFVDALDECPETTRDSLLTRLQQYSVKNLRAFLTSRLNVDVRKKIPHATRVEISASSHDITDFVEAKIKQSLRLTSFVDTNPDLKQHIVHSIVSKADGMFLLAGLQTESLGNQTCVRGIRSALDRLPTDTFTMYDQTFDRIGDQPKEDAELGLKVLSLIFGSTRPLEIDELRHALAIQPGDTKIDSEALTKLDILLSVTAGLVVTYLEKGREQTLFRLVHYTLQQYLEINQERLFPSLELDMARACLTYLSLDEFGSGQCATDELFLERRVKFHFLRYAAHHWAIHLRGVQVELMNQSLAFVRNSTKISAWLQCFEWQSGYIGLSISEDLPPDPVFLAAHFHLSELFKRLISSQDIDKRNGRGETPLLRAVDVEPWQKGGEPPFLEFKDPGTWKKDDDPPFLGSLDADQHAMVRVILDLNADINAKDPSGLTPAFSAVMNENTGILALLLERGADIDDRPDSGSSLMQVAAKKWNRLDIMEILLDRGYDIHVLTERRESLAHIAADSPTSDMLDYLIDSGALFDTPNEEGVTPLMIAAGEGQQETLRALIRRGARCDITDSIQKSLLHFVVSANFPQPNIVEVVMQLQNVNAVDVKGRTSLHYSYFWSAQFRLNSYKDRNTGIANVIRLLIEGGASETIVDADGRIPKDYLDWCTSEHGNDWTHEYWAIRFWEESGTRIPVRLKSRESTAPKPDQPFATSVAPQHPDSIAPSKDDRYSTLEDPNTGSSKSNDPEETLDVSASIIKVYLSRSNTWFS